MIFQTNPILCLFWSSSCSQDFPWSMKSGPPDSRVESDTTGPYMPWYCRWHTPYIHNASFVCPLGISSRNTRSRASFPPWCGVDLLWGPATYLNYWLRPKRRQEEIFFGVSWPFAEGHDTRPRGGTRIEESVEARACKLKWLAGKSRSWNAHNTAPIHAPNRNPHLFANSFPPLHQHCQCALSCCLLVRLLRCRVTISDLFQLPLIDSLYCGSTCQIQLSPTANLSTPLPTYNHCASRMTDSSARCRLLRSRRQRRKPRPVEISRLFLCYHQREHGR